MCDSAASIPDIYIVLHIQITVSRLCNGPVSARHYTLRGATTITQFGGDEESWSQGEDRRWTSAANRLIGEVVQSRRRPLLGPSPV